MRTVGRLRGRQKYWGREDVGEIKVGMQADLALFKLDEMRFSGAHDPLAALLLCGAQRADRVMVAGSWQVIDAQLVDFDVEQLMSDHSALATKLALKLNIS